MITINEAIDFVSSKMDEFVSPPYWMSSSFSDWCTRKWATDRAFGALLDASLDDDPDNVLSLLATNFYIFSLMSSNVESKLMFEIAGDTIETLAEEMYSKGDYKK